MSPSSTSSSDRPLIAEQGATIAAALRSLAIWALPALAIAAGLELGWRHGQRTPIDVRFAELAAHADAIDLVVVGSSHAQEGLDAALLSPAGRNLASGSQDLWYDAQLLNRWGPKLPKLKAVVWGLDLHGFGFDLARTEGENRLVGFYDAHLPRRGTPLPLVDRLVLSSALLRSRGPDPIADVVARLEAAGPAQAGAVPVAAPDPGNAAARARYHEGVCYRDAPRAENGALVIEATRALQARGVAVRFVVVPTMASYRAALSPGLLAAFAEDAKAIEAATGEPVHDFRDAVPSNPELFRDGDHLRGEGVRQFTERVKALLPP